MGLDYMAQLGSCGERYSLVAGIAAKHQLDIEIFGDAVEVWLH
jgi:hypothetical protein